MDPDQLTLMLKPLQGGSYTQLLLCGPLPSSPPPRFFRRILPVLSHWSGWPVRVVLCVDVRTAGWCEVWTDALCDVPGRHLEVEFHPVGLEGER